MSTPSAPFIPLTGPGFGQPAAPAATAAPAPRYKMPSLEAQALFSEARLGQECGLWLQDFNRQAYGLFTHFPAGGLRTQAGAQNLKNQHTKAGYPDYMLEMPRKGYAGLRIELKTATGRVAPAQTAWHALLRAQGYRVEVVRSLPEFIELLAEYLA